jgi:hypothetical protein
MVLIEKKHRHRVRTASLPRSIVKRGSAEKKGTGNGNDEIDAVAAWREFVE